MGIRSKIIKSKLRNLIYPQSWRTEYRISYFQIHLEYHFLRSMFTYLVFVEYLE
jgi:hypothetical protein